MASNQKNNFVQNLKKFTTLLGELEGAFVTSTRVEIRPEEEDFFFYFCSHFLSLEKSDEATEILSQFKEKEKKYIRGYLLLSELENAFVSHSRVEIKPDEEAFFLNFCDTFLSFKKADEA